MGAATLIPELRFGSCEFGDCRWNCDVPFFSDVQNDTCQDGANVGQICNSPADCVGFPCGGGSAGSPLYCDDGSECSVRSLQEMFTGALVVSVDDDACPPGVPGAIVTLGLDVLRADGQVFHLPGRRLDFCGVNISCSAACFGSYPENCTVADCGAGGSCPPVASQLCDSATTRLLDQDTCGVASGGAAYLTEASLVQFEFWLKAANQPLLEFLIAGLTSPTGPFPGPHGTVLVANADCTVTGSNPATSSCCIEAGFLSGDRPLGAPSPVAALLNSTPNTVEVPIDADHICTWPGPCGDSVVNIGEGCDDGNANAGDGCDSCRLEFCGDGIVNDAGLEECEDGNNSNSDGCLRNCAFPTCGDGFVRAGFEQCDDGNVQSHDGCAANCLSEYCDADIDTAARCAPIVQMSAGFSHNCAVRGDGTVTCWGSDTNGQASPPDGVFAEVAAGGAHTCGIKEDGNVVCWGSNSSGQSAAPPGVFTDLSAGEAHTCGVKDDGSVACWGSYFVSFTPTPAVGPSTGTFSEVTSGANHSCGLRDDGTAVCWGDAEYGKSTPPTDELVGLAAGRNHSCGLRPDGTVVCWGDPSLGMTSPPSGTFREIAAGYFHTCGIRDDQTVACWGGANSYGESTPLPGLFAHLAAGYGHTCGIKIDGTVACRGRNYSQESTPSSVFLSDLAANGDHTCGIRRDGSLTCWGDDDYGQSSPPPGIFTDVTAGVSHACALDSLGRARCWGADLYGESTPPAGTFTELAAGSYHTCGLRGDGTVECWGDYSGSFSGPFAEIAGGRGWCGIGAAGNAACFSPFYLEPLPGSYSKLAIGDSHACGIALDGEVSCWGDDYAGQASPPPGTFTDISAGSSHTCGIRSDGSVSCWGANWPFSVQSIPPEGTFTKLEAGSSHTCGITTDGTAVCWGSNQRGQSSPISDPCPGGCGGVGASSCPPEPAAGCRQSTVTGKSSLSITDDSDDAKDAFRWLWQRGSATSLDDFGDPVGAAVSYAVCLYDASSAEQPLLGASLASGGTCAGKSCWKKTGKNGFQFADKAATQGGLSRVKLKIGDDGEAKIDVRGRGPGLALPALPLVAPLTVQWIANDGSNSQCWETTFASTRKNDSESVRAKDE